MCSSDLDTAVRGRRDDDAEAERRKKFMPERQELIKIQDERKSDRFAPHSRFVAIFAQERFLILEQVVFRPGGEDRNRPVALVPPDKAPVAVERVDRQPAMIGALIADGGADGMREFRESVAVHQRRTCLTFVFGEPLRVERGAERAHQSGDSRPDNFASDFLLKGAEDGVVQERSALNDDMIAERFGIADADDFIQRVFDDADRESGGNIFDCRAVLLRLFHR